MGNRIDKTNNNDIIRIQIGDENLYKIKRGSKQARNKVKSTKYTLITFIPINLFEQFQRIANFYFLIMTIIQLTTDSPVSPITSLAPLTFVIIVTAIKQGYEDYLRHKADNVVNNALVTVIRNQQQIDIKCKHIVQGDLVLVSKDCDVPCDLVILKSSEKNGKCSVTTANLDGETNLKILCAPKELPKLPDEQLHTLGIIECEKATVELDSFKGKIILASCHNKEISSTSTELRSESLNNVSVILNSNNSNINGINNEIPLLSKNLLLRGSRIKDTDWIIGCAVYVGPFTKMALNSRLTNSKIPSSEPFVNKFIYVVLFSLLGIVIFNFIMKRYYEHSFQKQLWNLIEKSDNTVVFNDLLSNLVLFNYLIPISLYVTIELHKFLGSFYMEWDIDLYDEETDQPCIVNTSNLNEELGQVNILFSDKTGTLTKNEMYFKNCSIKGEKYIYRKSKIENCNTGELIDVNTFDTDKLDFFKALVCCHSVQVAIKDENEVPLPASLKESFFSIINHIRAESRSQDFYDESSEVLIRHYKSSKGSSSSMLNSNNSTIPSKSTITSSTISPSTASSSSEKKDMKIILNSRLTPSQSMTSQEENSKQESINTYNSIIINDNNNSINSTKPTNRRFNRSTSNIDVPDSYSTRISSRILHRRTQSNIVPSKPTLVSNQSIVTSTLLRSSRLSYAEPRYTQRTLSRFESTKRKHEIKSVVEKLDYKSYSPDEKALVEGSAHLGIIYIGDKDDNITIVIYPPHIKTVKSPICRKISFKRLYTIEFTSDRKKMSVIVRDAKKNIWMYTKGAESYVLPICSEDISSVELMRKTEEHVKDFARMGLRTLVIARKKISEEEYENFIKEIDNINVSLGDRTTLLNECYAKIERNLELLGVTAVEDALQDDVYDTLVSLKLAGIKIWVLTGDQVETAYNIGLSCGLILSDSKKYFITECLNLTQIREHLRILNNEIEIYKKSNAVNINFALLIDGISLTTALKYAGNEFANVAIKCQVVLCCRLSPLQKCEIVQLIKDYDKNYITAAIGDGANDVSMIQEAHVGLGIVGKEGRQAARCADYSFSKFNMTKKLLLVHGHYHSYRLSTLVLYFFYKNTIFMAVQFFFQIHSMFSTQTLFDSLFLTLYNVSYTSLPILLLSITEKPFTEDILMSNPHLYKNNVYHRLLRWNQFFTWIFFAIFHALICFYVTYFIWSLNDNIFTLIPFIAGIECFGTIIMHNIVVLVNFKLWMEAIFQSYIFIGTIILSILGFVGSTIIYNMIPIKFKQKLICFTIMKSTIAFCMCVLIVAIALLCDLFLYSFCESRDRIQETSKIKRMTTRSL